MTSPLLEARSLGKEYRRGGVTISALHGVDLEIARGEFVAITGPSGCGKSTLLSLLGGLTRPTSGAVLIDGIDLGTLTTEEQAALRRSKIGFVFQTFALVPTLTVQENVALPLILAGVPTADRLARIAPLLAATGLEAQRDFFPTELSGGQKQRVGIARALAGAPAVLLADEPTGNLDRATAVTVLNLLTRLRSECDLGMVMVTHDEEDAHRADRIVQLRDGTLVRAGRPAGEAS